MIQYEMSGYRKRLSNELFLRVVLATEVALLILWVVGLTFTIINDFDQLIYLLVYAFHIAIHAVAFMLLERAKRCEREGRCDVESDDRFMFGMMVVGVMITDGFSTAHFFIHNLSHLAGYHYMVIVQWTLACLLDIFYFAVAMAFGKQSRP
jgi:hypothetical protein